MRVTPLNSVPFPHFGAFRVPTEESAPLVEALNTIKGNMDKIEEIPGGWQVTEDIRGDENYRTVNHLGIKECRQALHYKPNLKEPFKAYYFNKHLAVEETPIKEPEIKESR